MVNSAEIKSPLASFYHWEKAKAHIPYLNQPVDGQWHVYTWKETGDQVRRMTAALRALDLPPKSKIALVSKNCAHWIMADLAIMMSGHISVPLYPNINAETANYVLTHSESKVLFVGKLDDWASMKPGVPDDVYCISFPDIYKTDPEYDNWNDLVARHEPIEDNPDRDLDEINTIVYTSGTTGRPKGVVHTFGSVGYAITGAMSEIAEGSFERLFSYLPLSHIAERMLTDMGSLSYGSTVYFAESLQTFADNLREASPTLFFAVPRIWTKFQMGVLAKMPQKKLDLFLKIPLLSGVIKKKLQTALGLQNSKINLTGAAPIPPSTMEWYKKIGIVIQEVYGMTENSGYSHFNRANHIKIGSVGQPMPGVDCKISDIGEILVKSKATMQGYYKQPELTADTFDGDYLRTGDQGEVDSQGFLKITGRVKDIFKTEKGKYVAPSPIEMHLSKNEFVEQCCIVGTGLPQPMALIVLSQEAVTKDRQMVFGSLSETLENLNPILEKHEKLKKAIVVREDWTVENGMLTPTMKIKRSPIENKYKENYTAWYSHTEVIVWEDD